jgi:glycosyltransferase involved in cell wall biosynthesis
VRPGGVGALTPLRVLSVISSSKVGGAEQVLATILRTIDRRRVEMSVVCPADGPLVETYRRHAAAVWTMDLGHVFDPRAIVRLARIMSDERVELAHTRLWNADVLGGLAARRARVPIRVASVHGGYHQPIGVTGPVRLRRALLSRGYRAIYRCFDCVQVGGCYMRDDLITRPGIRVDPRIVQLIPNGLDLDRVAPHLGAGREFVRRLHAEPQIITVANLIPMKGHEWVLRAMPQVLAGCPGARCVFAGDGPLRRDLERLAGHLGVDARVTFAGEVANPLPLVRRSDVFVLPSIASEGVSIALLEALALGTPVVGSRVGGIPQGLDDGRAGLLVPPAEPRALANAILSVLGDPALARRLSSAGQEHVRARFSGEVSTQRLAALYWDLARWKGIRESERAGGNDQPT